MVDETLNIDPFKEAITIPFLTSKISRDHVLPKNIVKAFTDSKKVQSKIASHWLYHLTTNEQIELHPEFYLKLIYNPKTHQLTAKIYKDTITIQLPKSTKFEYYFKTKNGTTRFNIDLSTNQ